MPIDTRIPLAIRPIEFQNPVEQYGQAMQIQSMQQRNRLMDLAMQEKAREAEQENALASLYRDAVGVDGSVDRSKVLTGAAQGGLGAVIPKLQKGFADQDRAAADAQKSRLESGIKQLEAVGQIAGSVKDPLSLAAANQQLAAMGIPTLGDTYDPARIAQVANMALSRKDQLEQQWKGLNYQLDVEKFGETRRHNRTQEGFAAGNLSVAQQNLGLRRQEIGQKERELGMGGKPPAGYRWKQDGTLEAIPGGPAEKDSGGTEGERNAAGYGMRMAEAEKIIGGIATKNPGAQKPGVVEKFAGPGLITNLTSSEDRQMYRQAQEDWVRAKLRKESGAVIGEEEMEREIQTYFPQKGEGDAVIRQKAQARRVAMDAMKTSAGKAGKSIATGNDIDALLKKYGG